MTLTWRAPSYPADRRLALTGQVEVGAVFPTSQSDRWDWRFWLGHTAAAPHGTAKTEGLAKAEVAFRFQRFLERAELAEAADV
jgi:hypothetical protein